MGALRRIDSCWPDPRFISKVSQMSPGPHRNADLSTAHSTSNPFASLFTGIAVIGWQLRANTMSRSHTQALLRLTAASSTTRRTSASDIKQDDVCHPHAVSIRYDSLDSATPQRPQVPGRGNVRAPWFAVTAATMLSLECSQTQSVGIIRRWR
jgi:hypothetical protein